MARQFREQLEEEVQLEEARKAQRAATPAAQPEPPPVAAAAGANTSSHEPAPSYEHREPATSYEHHEPAPSHEPAPPHEAIPSHEPAPAATHSAPAGNGSSDHVTPETPQKNAGDAPGTDPTAARPAHAGGADERRT